MSVEGSADVLGITRNLFDEWEKSNILYCHFKSNQHVVEGLCGKTDLDILVARSIAHEAQAILIKVGYKRFSAAPWCSYPAVEDYLGFDDVTGRLVHIHLHYELTLGEKYLKGYRLPWDQLILSTRILDDQTGIYIADPHVEMLLLLLRDALKIRFRDTIFEITGIRKYFRGGSLAEYNWLNKKVEPDQVVRLAHEYLGQNIAVKVQEMLDVRPHLKDLAEFRQLSAQIFNLFRTYGWLKSRYLCLLREIRWLWLWINMRYFHMVQLNRRFSPTGGRLIVFLGADGSGKSTMVNLIQKWLSWKLDAPAVYFGSGDGSSSLLRYPLLIALKILFKLKAKHPRSNVGTSKIKIKKANKIGMALAVWALVLSLEKRGKLRLVRKARNQGVIIIADRFPQNQVKGFNDGPLLDQWSDHPWPLFRLLARWEAMPYRWATMNPPDLVFKLDVDPLVAAKRKPDIDIDTAKSKMEAVRSFKFPEQTRVNEIDACLPIEDISLTVKQMIWKAL